MNDRELLYFASKAAGYAVKEQLSNGEHVGFVLGRYFWNPLHDDGDALRLAIKLKFCIQADGNQPWIEWGEYDFQGEPEFRLSETDTPDIYAATRRAIVRAAAEIGKAMEQQA